jgi:predicted permease
MAGRQREFAVRLALGAGSRRLARQVLTEGLVLSAIGGAVGLFLAYWTLPVLVRVAPDSLPRLNEVALNWRVTVFLVAIIVLIPVVFSLGPLVETIRSNVAADLRDQGRSATQSKRQRRIMSGAIIVQFGLASVLLTAAGLLLHSFLRASKISPGFESGGLLSMRIDLPGNVYDDRSRTGNLFNSLISRVATLPGVERAGAISELPTGSTANVALSIERGGSGSERADTLFCLGDALKTLGVRLIKGRLLQPDDYMGAPHTAVVSESLARRAWRNADDAIGRRIRFGVDDPMNDQPWLTVVGVVADMKARLNSDAPRLAVFTPPNDPLPTMQVLVRTLSDPVLIAPTLRKEVGQLDPNLATGQVKTVDNILSESLTSERFQTWLMSSFAITAMLLATLGMAGLLAYNGAQRIQEFGLRIALGATRRDLVGIILRDCLRISGTGIAIGLVAALITTRALSALLYDTSPLDLATFLGVPSILLLVAISAAIFPAWRVIHANPMTTLRAE